MSGIQRAIQQARHLASAAAHFPGGLSTAVTPPFMLGLVDDAVVLFQGALGQAQEAVRQRRQLSLGFLAVGVTAPPRRAAYSYHGLGTMLLSWVDIGSDLGISRDWIEQSVARGQLKNGTWNTYGDPVAPPLNGVTPSTAYAILALTSKDRRLPFLQR